jgi:hypothetical protein
MLSLYVLVHYTYRFVLWLNLNVQGTTTSSLYSEISAFRSQPKDSLFWGSLRLCHGSVAKPPEYQRGRPCSSPGHRPCGSCGRQRANFHPSSLVFPCHYHSTIFTHVSPGGWEVRPLVVKLNRNAVIPTGNNNRPFFRTSRQVSYSSG